MTVARFLLDEHLHGAAAAGLRRRGIDGVTVHEADRRGMSDESHIAWALEQGWVLVTADDDYLRIASTSAHAGIVLLRDSRMPIGPLVRGLEQIWATETMESMANTQRYL